MSDLQPEDIEDAHAERPFYDPSVLQHLFLGGCDHMIRYPRDKKETMAKAVRHLVQDGHGHHFAVAMEGTAIACSGMAIDCLTEAALLP